MYIAHISDLHVSLDDDTNLVLTKRLVTVINGFDILPDYTIVTGDLVNKKDFAAYKPCLKILNELKMPYFVVGGNHDKALDLEKALREYCPSHPVSEMEEFLQYEVQLKNNISLLAVDFYGNQQEGYRQETTRLDWLRDKLSQEKEFVIIMHKFPANTHLEYFEKNEKGWQKEFAKVVEEYRDKIRLIACGHLHNHLVSNIKGVPIISAGSHYLKLKMDFHDKNNALIGERFSTVYVHRFDDEDAELVSYLVDVPRSEDGN